MAVVVDDGHGGGMLMIEPTRGWARQQKIVVDERLTRHSQLPKIPIITRREVELQARTKSKDSLMKTRMMTAAALLLGIYWSSHAAGANAFRQVYPLDSRKVTANAVKVAEDLKSASAAWRNAPAIYYTVHPLSDIIRQPDTYPSDGTAFGTLKIIAAKGEFEPGSIVLFPQQNVDRFELRASDLKGPSGATIPASSVDIKLVKVWYQCGGAWFSQFADPTARMLIPEILLNDEDLIHVDGNTQDNYLRYDNSDGTTQYQWMSAPGMVTGYRYTNYEKLARVSDDTEKLQPVVLNKNEFKQFMVTLCVPKTALEGRYEGQIKLVADGKSIGSVPVLVRVLPFELPVPKTYYDGDKEFFHQQSGTGTLNPKIARNIVNHNNLHLGGKPELNVFNPAQVEQEVNLLKACGVSFSALFRIATPVNLAIWGAQPTLSQQRQLHVLRSKIAKTAALTKKLFGHTEFYSYGIDEGGADVVRAERAAWEIAHEAGGKVMVSGYSRRRLLYALDYMWQPGAPNAFRSDEAKLFHEMNPDALVGWYADPHGGPENPNYARRLYGLQPYKAEYDVVGNHTWWKRCQWNDLAQNFEPSYRNLNVAYLTRSNVLDTLQWEGCREGIDDVRYATRMKELANRALESKHSNIAMRGRLALGFLAYWDADRDDLDAFRMECINHILDLDRLLTGDKQ
jgi:hypothetical protein